MHFSPWPQTRRPAFFSALVSALLSAWLAGPLAATSAWAQSSCSSDGQRPPVVLVERFISADCDTCWADPATVNTRPGELALDWIVPTVRGDDAPLSAAASRDAPQRLQALGQMAPSTQMALKHKLVGAAATRKLSLRVARGLAFSGYMGASIELKAVRGAALPTQPLTAWLLLVEAVPAGTDGTPVARNLVRNALQTPWNERGQLLNSEQKSSQKSTGSPSHVKRLYESRPLSIPAGANPERLQVVGWVEDASGRVLASAASVCGNV